MNRDFPSGEQFEIYRNMTPGERLALSLRLTGEELQRVMQGTPEQINKSFEEINRENDLGNANILSGFRPAEQTRQSGVVF